MKSTQVGGGGLMIKGCVVGGEGGVGRLKDEFLLGQRESGGG